MSSAEKRNEGGRELNLITLKDAEEMNISVYGKCVSMTELIEVREVTEVTEVKEAKEVREAKEVEEVEEVEEVWFGYAHQP